MKDARVAEVVLVVCSAPAAAASELVRKLVEAGLAACVHVSAPGRSTYRWQGAVEEADEVRLEVKSTRERAEALVAALVEAHPYDVPEVLVVDVTGGHAPYLDWVRASVLGGGG